MRCASSGLVGSPARHNQGQMDPSRKRRIRLVVALTAAVVLAGALVWTSFGAADTTTTPGQLLASAQTGKTYQLTGKVAPGYTRNGTVTEFRVRDRAGNASVPVRYVGSLPDPFRAGREVIVDVRKQGSVYVGQRDSLVTKCPSKFSAAKKS
jgi:cytochrome c-type biogenesis protein CcmE